MATLGKHARSWSPGVARQRTVVPRRPCAQVGKEIEQERVSRIGKNDLRFQGHNATSGGFGEVAEWLKAPHSKCGILARVSRVRIPPSPPTDGSTI
jgi:hypothetical protein